VFDLQTLGRFLLIAAAALAIVGVLLLIGSRLGIGSLPGDLSWQGEKWGCYLPIATSLLASLVLTLILNLVWRMFR
jgi:hypothetical protein